MEKIFEKALQIALDVHGGKVDKVGLPAILHPMKVALKGNTMNERVVGILHDTLEDADDIEAVWKAITEAGFRKEILDALTLLTNAHPKLVYDKYIGQLIKSGDTLALTVKLNDMEDNIDRARESGFRTIEAKHVVAYDTIITALPNLGVGRKVSLYTTMLG